MKKTKTNPAPFLDSRLFNSCSISKRCRINLRVIVSLTALAILLGPIGLEAAFDFNRTALKANSDLIEVKRLLKGEHKEDEIVVKFKGDLRPFRVIKVPQGKVGEKLTEYLKRRDVEYAEPNYIAYALMTPNDPYYSYQWHLDNSAYGGINMESAWSASTGSGVTVAIIDTGIAYENYGWGSQQAPDLANTCFVAGYDFVNNDSHPNDDEGHGTHVAGTVAQSTNNNLGVAGVAFDACLMPVKVLNSNGSGSYSDVADGIIWAADNGAQVINLSLGGSADSQTLENAVAHAYNKGVVVVAAAGNDGSSSIIYPAAYDDYVMAVGATQYDQNLAPYSNYGSSLDLVAPGGNNNLDQNNDGYVDGVLQQTFQKRGWRTTWGYYFMQGTSMASPHVAGVAALVLANGNATTPDEVRTALQETAEDLGAIGQDNTFGWGLIDAYAALNWTAVPNNPPMANDQVVTTDEDIAIAITLTASDSDGDTLTYSIVAEPANGTLTGAAPNVIYTPEADYNGSDSFTFKANDGKADSNLATVSITINPVNDPPVADTQSVETTQDTALDITLTGSDVDGDSLTFAVATDPSNGSFTLDANFDTNGNLTYTPNSGYIGDDSFAFTVSDSILTSDPATVSITVTKVNHPPVADDQSVTTDEDTSKNITLTASDSDNDPLTYTVLTSPANGSLTGTAPNLTYTPELNFNGSDSFTFKVSDGQMDSNLATVSLTVNSVNDPPLAEAGPDQSGYIGQTLDFDGSGSADADGSLVSYDWDFDDGTADSGLTVSHIYSAVGTYLVTLTVADNGGLTAVDTATVVISEEPAQPTALVNIELSTENKWRRWRATALVSLLDQGGQPIEGVVLEGTWSGLYSRDVSGSTNGAGEISFRTGWLRTSGLVTFTVNKVVKDGQPYILQGEITDSISGSTSNWSW